MKVINSIMSDEYKNNSAFLCDNVYLIYKITGGDIMPAALTKECSRCGKTKRLNQFYENSTKADKRNGICKSCQKEVNNS